MLENFIVSAVLIFLARLVNITLSTVRTLMMTRGHGLVSAVMGFFEALLFALIISEVVQNLDNVWNLVGYSAGFSGGILLGMAVEERLATGYATVNVVSSFQAHTVAEAIRGAFAGRPTLAREAIQSLIQRDEPGPTLGHDLTPREREVLALLVKGMSNPEIAQRLSVSRSTVKTHVSNILSKLGVSSRRETIALAIEHKLVN